jgi:hypothetical protein
LEEQKFDVINTKAFTQKLVESYNMFVDPKKRTEFNEICQRAYQIQWDWDQPGGSLGKYINLFKTGSLGSDSPVVEQKKAAML